MPRVHVMTSSVTVGDAVSQDALGMCQTLREQGHEALLYAAGAEPCYQPICEPPERYEAEALNNEDDLLIYHHCIAWRQGVDAYCRTRNRRILKYHNITPALFFETSQAHFYDACIEGAAQTRELARQPAELWLGDSEYNAEELVSLGVNAEWAHALAPFHELESFGQLEADTGILNLHRDGVRNILFVGRVAPNKGHLDLIDTFAHYHRYLNHRSRLFIVGKIDERLDTYVERIRAAVEKAELAESVFLTGRVNAAQLKAYYLISHAFLCTSHHEGFCVPLVEAMRFQLPCVAYGSSAIPSTLGEEALVWDRLDPRVLAEALHYCIENRDVGDALVARQLERYERRYSRAAIERRFLDLLSPVLDGVAA